MANYPPLRILVLNDLLPPDSEGGLELSAMELGQALEQRGHDVHWVCSEWRKTFRGERKEHPKIHRILRMADVGENPDSKFPRKLESIRATERKINIARPNHKSLTRFLRSEGPFDVALVLGVLRVGVGTAGALTDCQIPIVWSVGDVSLAVHFSMPSTTRLYRMVFSTLGKKWHEVEKSVDFSYMLFTSEFVRNELKKAGIEPAEYAIVPRSVDFDPSYDPLAKSDPPVIFIASRLTPARGVHVAIEAGVLLAERSRELPWVMRIAGSGDDSYLTNLKRLAEPIAEHVQFLGKIPKGEIISELRQSSIAINPTVEVEGFGRANVEALACGVALIASDVPAVHEVVDKTQCALLYQPTDSRRLSELIELLLSNPDIRQELALKGLERAGSYTLERVASEVEMHLASAVRNSREKRAS